MDRDFSVEAYIRLVVAAIEGRLIPYSDVAPRRVVGTNLYRIADYEKAHRRPPLTAIVVHKQEGRPGEGFRIAMEQVGYAKPGESDEDLWARACADVFAYWRPWAREHTSSAADSCHLGQYGNRGTSQGTHGGRRDPEGEETEHGRSVDDGRVRASLPRLPGSRPETAVKVKTA